MEGPEPVVEEQQEQPAAVGQAPLAAAINQRHLNLIKLFTSQASTLPKFKASRGELWRSFETTFCIKWANSTLGQFPIAMKKCALLGCLEGEAAKAHTLLAEESEGWALGTTMELFLVQVRNLFNPPEESALASSVSSE